MVFLFLYIIIVEVFSILFQLMGMPPKKARFQVLSLMTNCGYTTSESEIIVNSKRKRKLALVTMLFGYTFNVTIVSSLVNIIISISSSRDNTAILTFIYITAAFIFIFILYKAKFVRNNFNRFINHIGKKLLFDSSQNILDIVEIVGNSVIGEVKVIRLPDELRDKTLIESGIRMNYGIQILAIIRGQNSVFSVTPEDYIEETDKILIFGQLDEIIKLFEIK